MNEELKAKWIAALRSGKYEQGTQDLRKTTGQYCCLGVLCDLVHPESWKLEPEYPSLPYIHFGHSGFPADEFLQEVNLSGNTAESLASKNDIGWTFAMIADWIERNL